MYRKWFGILLTVCMLLSLSAGCAQPVDNTDADAKQPAADDTAVIAEVETLATTLANAVMAYDLKTLKQYSVLDTTTCESIHKDMLHYTEDGKIDWDGEICDTYEDFIATYDGEMNREYEKLILTITDTQLYNDTTVLADADAIELLHRDAIDTGDKAIYEGAVAKLKIDRVAVVTFDVVFQDIATAEPGGTTQTYEEQSGTVVVYLVQIDGVWKSYSPTLAGVFPPLLHFPRYVKTEE
jgi:hypothetical protein